MRLRADPSGADPPAVAGALAAALAALLVAAGCGHADRRADSPVLVPWHRIGDIALGTPREDVLREYGAEPELGYRLHCGRVQITFNGGRVTAIWFSTRYYRTKSGFGVGSTVPLGPCHRTRTSQCEHRWHGFIWNAWIREKPCSCWVKVGLEPRSQPVKVKNFLKPWFFIDVRRGRVSSFYFASRFVD
jgi:hypothetical protein